MIRADMKAGGALLLLAAACAAQSSPPSIDAPPAMGTAESAGAAAPVVFSFDQRLAMPTLTDAAAAQVKSQCGPDEDMKEVEFYNNNYPGLTNAYVEQHAPATVQLQWLSEREIREKLGGGGDLVVDLAIAGDRWCTGTLIARNRIITAEHCFEAVGLPSLSAPGFFRPEQKDANRNFNTPYRMVGAGQRAYFPPEVIATLFQANFYYQKDRMTFGESPKLRVHRVARLVERGRRADGGLDYAILELGPDVAGALPESHTAPAPVANRPALAGERIAVFQHPNRRFKLVAAGTIAAAQGSALFYSNVDTLRGSSGAGVLDAQGRLIGVHTNGGCDDALENFRNRGVAVNSIAQVSNELIPPAGGGGANE